MEKNRINLMIFALGGKWHSAAAATAAEINDQKYE